MKIYYGWLLLLVCICIQAVGYGSSLYLYTVVISAIREDFPTSRAISMMGVMFLLLMTGLMSPKIGSLLDRIPVKRVLIVGGASMGVGFLLLSISANIWHVIACYAIFISLGMTVLSPLSCSVLMSRWFNRHRGLALGASALGTQTGGVLLPPTIATLFGEFGWRPTLAGLGVFVVVSIFLLTKFFVIDRPQDIGLNPDGDPTPADVTQTVGSPNHVRAANVPNKAIAPRFLETNFLVVVFVISTSCMIYSGLLPNLSLISKDVGLSLETSSMLVSILSLTGMVFSPLIGRLTDFISIRQSLWLVCIVGAATVMLFSAASGFSSLLTASISFGVLGAAILPTWAATFGKLYDSAIYGRMFGASTLIVYVFAALAAPMIGAIYDRTGGYGVTFGALLTLTGLGAVIVLFTRRQDNSNSPKAVVAE